MSSFGIKIFDTDGNVSKITPDIINIVSSGLIIMPDALVDTDKYYYSVDLPGTSAIPINNVGCVLRPVTKDIYYNCVVGTWDEGWYSFSVFSGYDDTSLYTKTLSTGVMTSWTPGDGDDYADVNDFDPICGITPATYWEKLSVSTVTDVKIFSTMNYHVYDGSAASFVDPHDIDGTVFVRYGVLMRREEE